MTIQSLLTKKGSLNQYQLKDPNEESLKEIEYVKEKTSFYITKENDDFIKDFKIRYYLYKNNLQLEDIICSHQDCNNQTSYNRAKVQFNQVCCNACRTGNINISNKKKKNYSNKTQEEKNATIQKRMQTNQEKYGGNAPLCSKEIQEKQKRTNLEKYGKEYTTHIATESFKRIHGVINPGQLEDHQTKVKETNQKNLGVDYPAQSVEVRNKMKNSNIEKYECEFPQRLPEIKNKWSKKQYEDKNLERLKHYDNKEYIKDNFIDEYNRFKLNEFMDFFACGQSAACKHMIRLGIDYIKYKSISRGEKEVFNFIEQLVQGDDQYKVLENDRTYGKEFDILVTKNNKPLFAIEYNGLYWHSYDSTKKQPKEYYQNKHVEKTNIANQNGFNLFHIYENEWIDNNIRSIWKSVFFSELNKTTRIFARKCTVKEVHKKEAGIFLDNNHLQGRVGSKIYIGLYYQDELVSIMSIGKNRFRKDNENIYELHRFCNKKFLTVIGGASKLLKYFERNYNPIKILSYANRRWSQGNLYNKLGFKRTSISPPNHYFIENGKLFHRVKYQTHKVKEILGDDYNNNISGFNNAIFNLKLGVIWDSGNYTFEKSYLTQ